MFFVDLHRCCDARYRPATIDPQRYLFELAQAISRSVPDAEVHAWLGRMKGDEVVFHARADKSDDDDIELF